MDVSKGASKEPFWGDLGQYKGHIRPCGNMDVG